VTADQKGVLKAMAAVGVSFGLSVLFGSMVRQSAPQMSDNVVAVIVLSIWVVMSFGILYVLAPWKTAPKRVSLPLGLEVQARDAAEAFRSAKRDRIAQLSAEPNRSQYARLMERGEWWTDEQIAYCENPQAVATCVHLQPIERAMRSTGIVPRLLTQPWDKNFAPLPNISADCRINEVELKRLYPGADSIRHTTGYWPERSATDNPWAKLACAWCNSSIEVVHPEWPGRNTVWFPSAP
jgi:hypothetical protein